MTEWWRSLYDDTFADFYLVRRDETELRATLAFLRHQLDLKPGDRVFDQCCGVGGLSVPLAQSGLCVVGVDVSAGYIRRAQITTEELGVDCTFHCADAFQFVPDQPCEAAINWRTSFGYAEDERNRQMLRCAFAALKPGGRFALDFQNVPGLLRGFQTCMTRRQTTNAGEILLLRESRVDLERGQLVQGWTFVFPDGRRVERESSVRLYLPHQLAEMLQSCGFVEPRFFGGERDEPLTLDSPRCIVVVRRPA